jgi:iron complex outermembrane receptor protein
MSKVDHPMSTFYRISSGPDHSNNEKTNDMNSRIDGVKIKNSMDLGESAELTYGLDYSKRNWDGAYKGEGMQAPVDGLISIDDTDTTNKALFVELEQDFTDFNLKAGARYDTTEIESGGNLENQESNDYNSVSGFLFGTYRATSTTNLFGGIGRSHRVPDARELYFRGSMVRYNMTTTPPTLMMVMHPQLGTPDLEQTSNTEIDFGFESRFQDLSFKTRLFYSWLKDYIYYNSNNSMNRFENIDATLYGLDVSGSYYATDSLYLDFGLAYQRGRKDEALDGQTDKDLAEITPLKLNLGLTYEYMQNGSILTELVAADDWDDYDSDNGEQKLGGYAVVNLKLNHELNDNIEITAGIDNLFDRTYAVSNTYKDLTLLAASGDAEVMLLNEPGRYYYLNTTFRF